jgi:hypothetical protein
MCIKLHYTIPATCGIMVTERRANAPKEDEIMWTEGNINGYKYWVKYYENGSEFGIDEGRISKLTIRKAGTTRDLCNFDRGWDIQVPEEAQMLYESILAYFE